MANTCLETAKYTKREALAQIVKVFDSAGCLAQRIVLVTIFMQKKRINGTRLDQNLSSDTLKTFQSIYSAINSNPIPRWIDYCKGAEFQFSNACEKAYAVAIYISIRGWSSFSAHLLCKTSQDAIHS